MLLPDIIRRGADAHPDRTAILFRDASITYAQLAAEVDRIAAAFAARGLGPGDRVALLLPNCPEFTVSYFATAAIGGVCTPANPQLKPAELTYMWNDSQVKLAITVPPLAPAVLEAARNVPSLTTVVTVGGEEDPANGVIPWDALIDQSGPAPAPEPTVRPADPAVCIYTSGTTGRPKGALLSHRNLTANCESIAAVLDLHDDDNFLTVLPLFHAFAATVCQNAALFCGTATTYVESFHPARVLEVVRRHRVTLFPGVPAMFGAMLNLPADRTADLSSVRLAVSGGAPMPVAVMTAFEQRFGLPIIEGDGPTECSPVTAVNPPYGVRKPGSIGPPVPGVEMRIVDEHDRELPPNEIGEIVVRGDNVMIGYHNLPQETAEAMRSGWYHTGDMGKVDEDGYFYIVDRKKDMLIVGGLNVYPREVEEVLYTHPAVAEAAVVGQHSELRGEEPVAVIVLKPGASATNKEIIRYCRDRLANYKVPRRVVFREAMPVGGTGKVLKRLLRKELELEA